MKIQTKLSTVFQTPAPSRATRQISLRSKASLRGSLVAQLPADACPRKIMFESKLEQDFLLLVLARQDVHDIWDQPSAVKYQGQGGKLKSHTFDYLVTLMSGEKVAIAVKPSALVIKCDFVTELELIRSGTPVLFADRVQLITERNFDKNEVRNAAMFHDFRKTSDPEAKGLLKELVADIQRPTTITDLVARSGFGPRMFHAIVLAIYSGDIAISEKAAIDYPTVISAGVMP